MPDADTTSDTLAADPVGPEGSAEALSNAVDQNDAAADPVEAESPIDTGVAASGELGPTLDGSAELAEPRYELDPVLAASEDAARAALAEITPADTIGELVATVAQGEHVVSLQFANRMRGYPGWLWTATLSRIDETESVNVLEVELLPGEGAVLAPDWVPWSVRLADYRAAQDAAGEEFDGADGEESDDDEFDDAAELDDEDDSDEDDSDEDDSDEGLDDESEADDDDDDIDDSEDDSDDDR